MLDIAELSSHDLRYAEPAEPSSHIRKRILEARRFSSLRGPASSADVNARLSASQVRDEIELSADVKNVLNQVMETHKLSARSLHKAVRVARTIAELASSFEIRKMHMLEALSYRHYLIGRLVSG